MACIRVFLFFIVVLSTSALNSQDNVHDPLWHHWAPVTVFYEETNNLDLVTGAQRLLGIIGAVGSHGSLIFFAPDVIEVLERDGLRGFASVRCLQLGKDALGTVTATMCALQDFSDSGIVEVVAGASGAAGSAHSLLSSLPEMKKSIARRGWRAAVENGHIPRAVIDLCEVATGLLVLKAGLGL